MHVLLIEDDPRVAAFVAKSLREDGHQVDHCVDAFGITGYISAVSMKLTPRSSE